MIGKGECFDCVVMGKVSFFLVCGMEVIWYEGCVILDLFVCCMYWCGGL